MIAYLAAVLWFSSTVSLTILTLPLSAPESTSSSASAIARQGPHPFSPEIDYDQAARLQHLGFEIRVRNLANRHGMTLVMMEQEHRLEAAIRPIGNPNYERAVANASKAVSRGGEGGQRAIQHFPRRKSP